MTSIATPINVVTIDTGPPGTHSGYKILRIANVDGGSGDYSVVWTPICDLTATQRQKISCALDYRDVHLPAGDCNVTPPCDFYTGTPTCCRSGNCGGAGVYTRYHTGQTDRELVVTIDNIPQFSFNSSPPCQLVFHWQLTDNVTGDTTDGCCAVVFQWRVITPPPLTVTFSNCHTTVVVDTSLENPSATQTTQLATVSGGVGPYVIEWQALPNVGPCVGTFSDQILTAPDRYVVHHENVPMFSATQGGNFCRRVIQWTVRDLGLVNEFGDHIGRVETGTCITSFNYVIVTPPALGIEVVGCGDTITKETGPVGPHTVSTTMQVGDITSGSGNYTVQWNTTPTIMSGTCSGDVVATVNSTNERLLDIEISNIPQFSSNSGSPCVRGYSARVIDNITGVIQTVQCQTTVNYVPTGAPPVSINMSGCGSTTNVDTGTCSTSLTATKTVVISSITGGSGNYTVAWGTPVTPACAAGAWASSLSTPGGQQYPQVNVTFTGNTGGTGACTYTRPVTVTDNVSGSVTTATCVVTMNAAPTTQCGALNAVTTGCGATVHYANSVSASGTTAVAALNVAATGGSGSYAISWNTTPVSTSGTCYTQSVSQSAAGSNNRSLNVSLTGIPTAADNTASPCVRTYQYTITDTNTAVQTQGTCSVTFIIDQVADDCALTYTTKTCDTSTVNMLTTAPVLRTMTINGLAGGFSGANYVTTWTLNTTCGGRAVFDSNGLATMTTSSTSPAPSAVIRFQTPINLSGSCSVTASAAISSTDPANSTAHRLYCGAAITCTYAVTWNTQSTPAGTIACPTGTATLTNTSNTATRTYSLSGLSNTSSVAWAVTGCGAISVAPTSGTGNTISVTYTASTAGSGISGSCAPVITATLTGPGGTQSYTCTDSITYDTRPSVISISSISNCGQTKSFDSSTRSGSFTSMTITHSAGAGSPYTYEWTRVNQTGQCTGITYAPTTAATQTFTPSVTIGTSAGGTCVATYQARVKDSSGVWSAPVQCALTSNYVAQVVTATITPSGEIYGSCEADLVIDANNPAPGRPCAPMATASVVPANGFGPFTYAWTRLADPNPSYPGGSTNFLTGADLTRKDVTFTGSSGTTNKEWIQTWRCTVTDTSNSSVTTVTVDVDLERHNNL